MNAQCSSKVTGDFVAIRLEKLHDLSQGNVRMHVCVIHVMCINLISCIACRAKHPTKVRLDWDQQGGTQVENLALQHLFMRISMLRAVWGHEITCLQALCHCTICVYTSKILLHNFTRCINGVAYDSPLKFQHAVMH